MPTTSATNDELMQAFQKLPKPVSLDDIINCADTTLADYPDQARGFGHWIIQNGDALVELLNPAIN